MGSFTSYSSYGSLPNKPSPSACSSRAGVPDDSEKLSSAPPDAKEHLNPHQVDAALFAFKSPLSNGAILADEVGLGKTIEAGILLSQFWASGKKKLLIIGPSNLRRQWAQELEDKFYLSSVIMDSKRFKELHAEAKHNPLDQHKVIICSFHFAKAKADYINLGNGTLCIDEAHRLRNVYRPSNKIGKAHQSSYRSVSKKYCLPQRRCRTA
ncbi:MAG: DEAD/DEAH box helicase family protein [Flavobacteriales bacterium]|nr:DEAD/DEAH box helicase family protein [Flavobacteriales bacterium]